MRPAQAGTEIARHIEAGGAMQVVLFAREAQALYVGVAPETGETYFQIINPDTSRPIDGTDAGQAFRSPLGQSDDQVTGIMSRESRPLTFDLIVGIA